MRFRVEVGVLILLIAFIVNFFGGIVATLDLGGTHRVVAILLANPHRYLEYIQYAVLFLILPPAVGLAFSTIAYIQEIKSPRGVLELWLPIAVLGGFFFWWGLNGLQWVNTNYHKVMRWIILNGWVCISDYIQAVYTTVAVGNYLWIFTGILLMLSPAFKMMLHNKGKSARAIAFLFFILIEIVGYVFLGDTSVAAAAFFSLLFSFSFFGFFILAYLGSAFHAMVSPWLGSVRRMEGVSCFNPLYAAWLFENDRRGWAAYITVVDVLFTPFIGIILYLVFAEGYFGITNSFIGFCVAFLFLVVLAWCFYEGFWKPRTREVHVGIPDSVEAEWRDKKL